MGTATPYCAGRELERYGTLEPGEAGDGKLMALPDVQARFRKRLEKK